jgi:hypothetical protein
MIAVAKHFQRGQHPVWCLRRRITGIRQQAQAMSTFTSISGASYIFRCQRSNGGFDFSERAHGRYPSAFSPRSQEMRRIPW